MKRDDRLTKGSTGSALCPPEHPSHSYSVETDLKRKEENRGSMNIEYALEQDYVSGQTKAQIEKLLNEWELIKPKFGTEPFNSWVNDVMIHFRGLESQGIDFIKKYYPDYNQ